MQTSGNLDDLLARLREQAQAEAEAILERARKAAERDITRRRGEAQERQREEKERILRRATAGREARLMELTLNERRAIMQRKEWAVEQVFAAAIQTLATAADAAARRDLILRLVREAVDSLGIPAARVRLNTDDRRLAVETDLFRSLDGVSVHVDEETLSTAGGAVVSDESGRLIYENTFETRLERRREALRLLAAEALELQNVEGAS